MRPAVDPLGLRFEEIARARPWALLSPFVAHDLADPPAAPGGAFVEHGSGPRAPYCAAVADIAAAGPGGVLRLGLADGGTRILGAWDVGAGTVAVEVAGPRGSLSRPVPVPVEAPAGVALVVTSDRVTVLVRPRGGDWRPACSEGDGVSELVDVRDPRRLERLRYVHATSGDVRLSRLRFGVSGPVGVRDPQVVRTARGEPLIRDGKLFLTLTSAGYGFFSAAHWGVWTVDLADPTRLVQTAALFFSRDGLVLGDHAGQLVVDEDTGRTTVLVSSWGDFRPEAGVHIRHLTTELDLLSGVHVLESDRMELPTPHHAWDPSLARIDGTWHLAFVECTSFGPPRFVFHPALARTGAGHPDRGWVRTGADGGMEQTEGTVLQRFGDRWYLLASDRDAAEYPVYETTGMRRLGSLSAPYGSNIPHPMVVPTGAGDGTPWWLLTFDGTPWHDDVLGYGTHGDFVVLAGRPGDSPPGLLGRLARSARRRLGPSRED